MSTRQEFIAPYKYLYKSRDEEESEESDGLNFTGNINISDEDNFSTEFGWYNLLYVAANENYLNISKVVESPAAEFLYFVNYYKRKQELEQQRINRTAKL